MQVLLQDPPIASLISSNNQSNESFSSGLPDRSNHELSRSLIFTILLASCLAVIILLTILGNILVLIALYINFALRSPTHLLMGNLACADLLLGNSMFRFVFSFIFKIDLDFDH